MDAILLGFVIGAVLGVVGGCTDGASNSPGFQILTTPSALTLQIHNGSSAIINLAASALVPAVNAWNFIGISFDALTNGGTNGLLMQRGATVVVPQSASLVSPSASAAAYPLAVGAAGNGGRIMASGFRFGGLWAWSVPQSQTSLTALFNATRSRYGV